ncbi:MAG: DUF1549 domain-containing protein [Phycisphaeraceae bacterium]
MIRRSPFAAVVFVLLAGIGSLRAAEAKADPALIEYFETKVRPVLATHCFKCHSEEKQKGDLRLDSLEAMLVGGSAGPSLVPGKPDKSLLIEAIMYENEDLQMPPKDKLSQEDIEAITHWVKLGAVWPGAKAGGASVRSKTAKISDEDRAYWAFQPVSKPSVPKVKHTARVINAIDSFLLAKLEGKGLTYSPEADKVTLIRRATFDLHGLPPTPEEVDTFVKDTSADAWTNLLDRLLASPRYGERWARHWLDLVRYSDSDGFKADDYRPHIWRYRDWVIRAFNDDMPYDQFLTWQLAGDEAAPLEPDAVIATGYLRLGPYEYNQRDVHKQWNEIVDDMTGISGEVFLGLSMHCARCHNHKFDPILQEDYFRLRAFFEPVLLDEQITASTKAEHAAYAQKYAGWEAATQEIRAKIEAIEGPVRRAVEKPAIVKYTDELQRILLAEEDALSPGDRQIKDLAFRQLVAEHKKIDGKIKADQKTELNNLYAELRKFDSIKPAPLTPVMAARDVGPVAPPTTIPSDRSQRVIAPGRLAVLGDTKLEIAKPQAAQSTGRRLALATWLTDKDHPLASRVIVNRLWQYHFATGIVATANDFGHQGDLPTHPELLDWLAREFVARGWKIKDMHKLIMSSSAYRQSAVVQESGVRGQGTGNNQSPPTPVGGSDPQKLDPGNQLLWRFPLHRLQAEQLRDAMLFVSGELDAKMYGTGVDDSAPRRSVYLKFMRNNRPDLIEIFDGPDGFNSFSKRNITTIAPQALMLINSDWTVARARKFAEQARREASGATSQMIELAFRKALGRAPQKDELTASLAFIDEQARRLGQQVQIVKDEPKAAAPTDVHGIAVDYRKGQRMLMKDPALAGLEEFTIEATFMLRSIDGNANVRTIASQWDGNTANPGWSLGVTGVKSRHKPQSIILQLVGLNEEGQRAYEVVASNLKPELDRFYHLVVNVKLSEIDSTGITFRLQPLADGAMPESSSVGHAVVRGINNDVAFVIGGRDMKVTSHGWDGVIADVRLYCESLSLPQLVGGRSPKTDALIGDWRFDPKALTKDASGKGRDLKNEGVLPSGIAAKEAVKTAARDSSFDAFVDFCHVLLNSNEFLYID